MLGLTAFSMLLMVTFAAGCGSSSNSSSSASAASGASTSSSSASSGSGASVKVGAVYLDVEGFYGGIAKGIKEASAGHNVNLISENVHGDAATESQFMSTLQAAGVKAIITSPVSLTASAPAIIKAAQAGTPVVCYNTCLAPKDMKYVKAFVTSDQTRMGQIDGRYAANYFKGKGVSSPKIAILNCSIFLACQQRDSGFETTLKKLLPGAQIVANQLAYTPDKAPSVAEAELTANPTINAFYGDTDVASSGAVQAVLSGNDVGKVVVFGSDISNLTTRGMLQHPTVLLETIGQHPDEMGADAMKQTLNAVSGKHVTSQIYIPLTLFQSKTPMQIRQWMTEHPSVP